MALTHSTAALTAYVLLRCARQLNPAGAPAAAQSAAEALDQLSALRPSVLDLADIDTAAAAIPAQHQPRQNCPAASKQHGPALIDGRAGNLDGKVHLHTMPNHYD